MSDVLKLLKSSVAKLFPILPRKVFRLSSLEHPRPLSTKMSTSLCLRRLLIGLAISLFAYGGSSVECTAAVNIRCETIDGDCSTDKSPCRESFLCAHECPLKMVADSPHAKKWCCSRDDLNSLFEGNNPGSSGNESCALPGEPEARRLFAKSEDSPMIYMRLFSMRGTNPDTAGKRITVLENPRSPIKSVSHPVQEAVEEKKSASEGDKQRTNPSGPTHSDSDDTVVFPESRESRSQHEMADARTEEIVNITADRPEDEMSKQVLVNVQESKRLPVHAGDNDDNQEKFAENDAGRNTRHKQPNQVHEKRKEQNPQRSGETSERDGSHKAQHTEAEASGDSKVESGAFKSPQPGFEKFAKNQSNKVESVESNAEVDRTDGSQSGVNKLDVSVKSQGTDSSGVKTPDSFKITLGLLDKFSIPCCSLAEKMCSKDVCCPETAHCGKMVTDGVTDCCVEDSSVQLGASEIFHSVSQSNSSKDLSTKGNAASGVEEELDIKADSAKNPPLHASLKVGLRDLGEDYPQAVMSSKKCCLGKIGILCATGEACCLKADQSCKESWQCPRVSTSWWYVSLGILVLGGVGYGTYWYRQRRQSSDVRQALMFPNQTNRVGGWPRAHEQRGATDLRRVQDRD